VQTPEINYRKVAYWQAQQLKVAKALIKADKETVAAVEVLLAAAAADPTLLALFDGEPHLKTITAALDFVRG